MLRAAELWASVVRAAEVRVAAGGSSVNDMAGRRLAELQARLAGYNATAVPPGDRLRPDPASSPRLHDGAWMPWRASVVGNGCPQ